MNVQTVNDVPIEQSLELWHQSIRRCDIEEADLLHNEIQRTLLQNREWETESYFQLYKTRYLILKADLSAAHATLQQIEQMYRIGDDLRGFYFHFYSGILATSLGEYERAETSFIKAYRLLNHVMEQSVKADFFYKASIFYYHIRQPLTALTYADEALKGLSESQGYEIIRADCENLMGLSCTTLKQYVKAEEHFLTALDMAKKENHQKLLLLIKYNLGYLYAEQNISELAIRHLLEVYEKEDPYPKTIYLLAREHYKLNDREKAEFFVKEGFEYTNEEYKHHFNILRAFHSGLEDHEIVKIVTDAFHYFEKHELFGFIEDYSGELALKFHQNEDHQKASYYFHQAFLAKQNILKKEALK